MNKLLKAFLIGAGVGTLGYGAWQIFLLYSAVYRIKNFKINTISSKNIDFELDIEVENKSSISPQIRDQNYTIYLNGILVSTIESKDLIRILSNGKTLIPLHINFDPKAFLASSIMNLTTLLTDKSKINIEIRGVLTFKSIFLNLHKYPVDIKYTLQELIDSSKN